MELKKVVDSGLDETLDYPNPDSPWFLLYVQPFQLNHKLLKLNEHYTCKKLRRVLSAIKLKSCLT